MSTRRIGSLLCFLVGSFLFRVLPSSAAPVRQPHVDAELWSADTQISPSDSLRVGLSLKIEHGWHVYWSNPGDSGQPPSLRWQLPRGAAASSFEWPTPERVQLGPLANYGYSGEVLLVSTLRPPASGWAARAGTLALPVAARWLVCKEVCLPGKAEFELRVDLGSERRADPTLAQAFAIARERLPTPARALGVAPRWRLSADARTFELELDFREPRAHEFGRAELFLADGRWIEHGSQRLGEWTSPTRLRFAEPFQDNWSATQARGARELAGVVRLANRERVLGIAIAAPLDLRRVAAAPRSRGPDQLDLAFDGAASPAAAKSSDASMARWLLMLLAALAGGLMLNLMPCVFPVVSIKVMSFVRARDRGDAEASLRSEAFWFSFGMAGSAVLLGGALLGARALGAQIGWGFQLQSASVVALLALLFFALALSFMGAWAGGERLWGRLASAAGSIALPPAGSTEVPHRRLLSVASGALSVVVAAPCTAPFMGAALGFAITQPPLAGLLVFLALGVGMALPYLVMGTYPKLLARLPRPGAWMVRLQGMLAVPLLLTVVWLVWTLVEQRGAAAGMWLQVALIALGFSAWWSRDARSRWVEWSALALAVVLALLGAQTQLTPATSSAGAHVPDAAASDALVWAPYSADALARARESRQPVLVNFTAAWCLSCQVNERVAFQAPGVRSALARAGIVLLKADWTRGDEAITQALGALGRSGVPVYAWYPSGAQEPELLPELLTPSLLLSRLGLSVPN